jgi:hypothetical protein
MRFNWSITLSSTGRKRVGQVAVAGGIALLTCFLLARLIWLTRNITCSQLTTHQARLHQTTNWEGGTTPACPPRSRGLDPPFHQVHNSQNYSTKLQSPQLWYSSIPARCWYNRTYLRLYTVSLIAGFTNHRTRFIMFMFTQYAIYWVPHVSIREKGERSPYWATITDIIYVPHRYHIRERERLAPRPQPPCTLGINPRRRKHLSRRINYVQFVYGFSLWLLTDSCSEWTDGWSLSFNGGVGSLCCERTAYVNTFSVWMDFAFMLMAFYSLWHGFSKLLRTDSCS